MNEIEAILIREKSVPTKTSLEKFAGIWTTGEANEMKKIIMEGCG